MSGEPDRKKRMAALVAASGINLMIGLSYAWSLISMELVGTRHWSGTAAAVPFTLNLLSTTIWMIPGGRLGERFSPRVCTIAGGVVIGLGLFLSGFASSPPAMAVTYGLLVGAGFGLCASVTTATAIKWFPLRQKGLISGICTAAAALSAVYLSPVLHVLLGRYSVEGTFRLLGGFALAAILLLSLFLFRPPEVSYHSDLPAKSTMGTGEEISRRDMLKRPRFYQYWAMFTFAAAGGIMITGNAANIAAKNAGWDNGFLLVVVLAVASAAGRLSAGAVSDRIGVLNTLRILFAMQAVNLALFHWYRAVLPLCAGTAVAGFAYGGVIALFPAAVAFEFGIKYLNSNYAVMNTAYGMGAVLGPMMAGAALDRTGGYALAFAGAAALLFSALAISFLKCPTPAINQNPS